MSSEALSAANPLAHDGKAPDRPGRAAAFAMSVARIGVGCVLLFSAVPKIRRPYEFLTTVYQYELASPKAGQLVAVVTPWLELTLGICLVTRLFLRGAWVITGVMFCTFALVQYSVLDRGLKIACGCFTLGPPGQVTYLTFLRTAALALVAAVATYLFCSGARSGGDGLEPDRGD
jgi:uncharacterized membrane protein YphA (DoxX/SURF4 family)